MGLVPPSHSSLFSNLSEMNIYVIKKLLYTIPIAKCKHTK